MSGLVYQGLLVLVLLIVFVLVLLIPVPMASGIEHSASSLGFDITEMGSDSHEDLIRMKTY